MPNNFLIDFIPEDNNASIKGTSAFFSRFVSGNTVAQSGEGLKVLSTSNVILSNSVDNLDEIFIASGNNPVNVDAPSGFTIDGNQSISLQPNQSIIFKLNGMDWNTTYVSHGTQTPLSGNSEFMAYAELN